MMKIGIVGAGAMGRGIAQVAATAGHEVYLYDANVEALQSATTNLRHMLDMLSQKGKMTESAANATFHRFHFIEKKLDLLKDCNLVIEAIVENLDAKKALFYELQEVVSQDCILATNTSSLSITAIAAACRDATRVLGIHFFNPAPLMKLVEIIPAVQTDKKTIENARNLIESWGKTTVLAKDTPGFIVNRVARPFYGEALRIYEEGIADIATIDWAIKEIGQFKMGSFELMDFIGHDVNYTVTETVFREFFYDPRYKPSFSQKRLVEAGYLGKKSGQGFYSYAENTIQPEPNKNEALGEQIVRRVVIMLINEAADAVFWNIASKEDIDLAMTMGVNYPKGLLKWADDLGIAECVEMMDALYRNYHEDRYRCSPLLRRMAREGETFY
ncbi:MAG: 3-hydroxyacyl-CoA dehydrogenase NAD-binding domain-containing protein [Saprospiraceae bacterium]|nr:3-hydroxyacyl-CoA dehydrogenase NAD-binding domain-containing protein [Saprospiraceae bacterium]